MIGVKQKQGSDIQQRFAGWLVNNGVCSSVWTAKMHYLYVRSAEHTALVNGLFPAKLISANDLEEAEQTYRKLVERSLISNKGAGNSVRLFMNFLREEVFKAAEDTPSHDTQDTADIDVPDTPGVESCGQAEKHEDKTEVYKRILSERFARGFRLSSVLDMRKFRAWYEEDEKQPLSDDDSSIISDISSCGIVYDDKLFIPEKLVSEETGKKLLSYIEKTFASGAAAIYYNALYDEFSDDLSCERIYDADMLSRYLEKVTGGKYYFSRTYFSAERFVQISIDDEIRQCLIKHGAPVSANVICSELANIPQDKIRQTLSLKSEFLSNAKGEYFHSSLINFSKNDLAKISSLIDGGIEEKEFISARELLDAISRKYPDIMDNNAVLSEMGFRNAVEYSLRDKYAFQNKVISKRGNWISMYDVYSDFCRNKEQFSLDELKLLRDDTDSGRIYFEAVYPNSLRISGDTFVSGKSACFDVEATDKAIEMFMNGRDYIALKDICSFGTFPYAGFPWNTFLLESYAAGFSEKYCLVHSSYSENGCAGAVVKKSLGITSLDGLVPLVLADSNAELTDKNAVSYLSDNGYIAMRRYTGISSALIKAKEIRNRRENNR